MNLQKLFKMQKVLDDHIMDEHPELKWQNNLDWKVLALLVEIGECANEWRGFKKWSKNQKPNTAVSVLDELNGKQFWKPVNPLLEEYVDCLHFILSIGLELSFQEVSLHLVHIDEVQEMYLKVYKLALMLRQSGRSHKEFYYEELISNFLGLGKALGFTWEQIEQAYMDKNAVNHARQDGGY